jgi:hypothetical protein
MGLNAKRMSNKLLTNVVRESKLMPSSISLLSDALSTTSGGISVNRSFQYMLGH